MTKIAAGSLTALLALVLGIAMAAGGGISGLLGGSPPSPVATSEIPAPLLPVYVAAAETCPGLPWQVLAAIGYAESRHAQGRADPATGDVSPPIFGPAIDGRPGFAAIPDPTSADGWAHAEGPMQFLRTTWARWGRLAPGRPPGAAPSPHNAWDAIYSAAALLCGGSGFLADLDAAILRYNHSGAYVTSVLAKAAEYGWDGAAPAAP